MYAEITSVQTSHPAETEMLDPKTFYEKKGYYVWRNLVPHELIDDLLGVFKKEILPSKKFFFRQSGHRWATHEFTQGGHMKTSLLDPHDLRLFPNFSDRTRKIYCSKNVQKALSELTGDPACRLIQSMFFDANTNQPGHTGNYYLDSIPNGQLIAGWFALEDIQDGAGRFYVIPESQNIEFDTTNLQQTYGVDEINPSLRWLDQVDEYIKKNMSQLYAPILKKGDVLFWNSRTIHGASQTLNPNLSRKSLTAHYVPSRCGVGNI